MQITRVTANTILQRAALVIVSVLLSLLLAECFLRLMLPEKDSLYVWQPNLKHIFHPSSRYFTGVSGPSVFSINNDGFRGEVFDPEGSLSILCIGGSTTECLYLDDKETWPALLQRKLGFQIGSIGKSGCTTRENYMHLKYYAGQLEKLDAVMMMVGLNDMMKALSRQGYGESDNLINKRSEDSLLHTIFLRSHAEEKGWRNLRLVKFFRSYFQQQKGVEWQLELDDKGEVLHTWRQYRSASELLIDTVPDLRPALEVFEKNLNKIYQQSQRMNKKLILVNQTAIYKDSMNSFEQNLLWMGGIGPFQKVPGLAYYTPGVLRQCLDLYNQRLKDFCAKNTGILFIDVDSKLSRDTTVFYDDCHFNERGAEKVAELISKSLSEFP